MRSLNPSTTAKLFATGFTIGPIVDSLHNQSLLHYNVLPISIAWPSLSSASASLSSSVPLLPLFCSSWTVPPLLGIAYVVLGGILPRILELFLSQETIPSPTLLVDEKKQQQQQNANNVSKIDIQQMLRTRAFIAVATTALIIKLSEILETRNPGMMTTGLSSLFGSSVLPMPLPFLDHRPLDEAHVNFIIMMIASLSQWAILDGTISSLIIASITSVGGPLSELPFVANGVWEYIDQAADYFPLLNVVPNSSNNSININSLLQIVLGENYQNLALSSITGPCYFAVTMDAIALGRWFDSTIETDDQEELVP